MGWADNYIKLLKEGQTIQFRPRGNSMTPIIENGQLVTVIPIKSTEDIKKGDVVLCKVSGKQYLHKITAIKETRYQISNNRGYTNGWTSLEKIYGKYIKEEENHVDPSIK